MDMYCSAGSVSCSQAICQPTQLCQHQIAHNPSKKLQQCINEMVDNLHSPTHFLGPNKEALTLDTTCKSENSFYCPSAKNHNLCTTKDLVED